ncbi:MAG: hypothetical protein ABEH60_00670 [Halonotius sp.]
MAWGDDSRGQSMQLGAVLLFGFLVVALTTAQATVVPNAVADAELDHSQQVEGQLVDLSTAVAATSASGTPQPTAITLAPDYPPLPLFVVPPPGAGTLRTTTAGTVRIENAAGVTSSQSFDNYWTGATRTYATRALSYRPTYRELDDAPTARIEYGMLVTDYSGDARVDLADGRDPIVDGTEITIPVLAGEFDVRSRNTESLVVERVTDATAVPVADDGNPIRLRMPTTLPATVWREEIVGDEPTVDSVSVSGGVATITLDGSQTYELTVHRVVVGTSTSTPTPTYLRNTTAAGWPYPFDVRDRFNDRVHESTTIWVYRAGNYATPAATVAVPDDPLPGLAGDVCYTLQQGVTAGDRPSTYGSPAGSCE